MAQRNGGKAAKETPPPLQFAPANAVPSRGQNAPPENCDFKSRPSPLGVGNGFLFTFFAQLYFNIKKHPCPACNKAGRIKAAFG